MTNPETGNAAVASPEASRYAVLYVDDEEQALKYFKKAFGRDFEVLTATSVDQALAVLEAEHARVGVVLSDHRMPGKTGTELLARVKQSWPQVMRMLVTAYADMESAVEAVNTGAVYKYLTKPIDLVQTKHVLGEAMRLFTRARDREALLADKGELIQRAIVADRMRSVAAMAHGVSHHVRNSLTAVTCFFEEMSEKVAAARKAAAAGKAAGGDAYLDELLLLADAECARLCEMIREVEARGMRPTYHVDDQLDVSDLAARAADAARAAVPGLNVSVDAPAGIARVTVDGAAVVRMLSTLIVHADRYSPQGSAIRVVGDGKMPYWGTAAARIRILGHGAAWQESDVAAFFMPFPITTKTPNDTGLEMLDAFQTALGHEGDILAHPAPPMGPGFEVRLPLCPSAVRRPPLSDPSLVRPAV